MKTSIVICTLLSVILFLYYPRKKISKMSSKILLFQIVTKKCPNSLLSEMAFNYNY